MSTNILIIGALVVLVAVGGVAYIAITNQPVSEIEEIADMIPLPSDGEQTTESATPSAVQASPTPNPYADLVDKACNDDLDCGKLRSCVNGTCVVQQCSKDSDCPGDLWCGSGLHPAPGWCSNFPGAL